MKKVVFIGLMSILFVLAAARDSLACSCMVSDKPLKILVKEGFSESTAVFSGEVAEITAKDEGSVLVKIKAARFWKGKFQKEITLTTAKDGAMCGYNFEIGEKYLVYANGTKNAPSANLCSRTAPLKSNPDIVHLNRLKGLKPKKVKGD